jgi:chromosomal replication initiator protein
MDHIWQDFLTIIRDEVGSRVVDTWFKAVSLDRWDMLTNTAYLQTPNAFVRDWICKNYLNLCQIHLARLLHVPEIKIIIVQDSVQVSAFEPSAVSNAAGSGIDSVGFRPAASKTIVSGGVQRAEQEKAHNVGLFDQRVVHNNSKSDLSVRSSAQSSSQQNHSSYSSSKSGSYQKSWQNHAQPDTHTVQTQSHTQALAHSKTQPVGAANPDSQLYAPTYSQPNFHANAQTQSEVALYKPAKVASIKRGNYTNNNYSFDSFVVAQSNSLAYAAAHAVTEKPGQLYNPLFIYGKSGLGKTHLLHAIGGAIKQRNQKAVVLYQTTDRFVSEFINAIRFNKVHQFEAKYQSADVLLIDDVQFISHKGQTQEAFFHIFNLLYDAHKQIVFSSDTFPQDMDGIAERLRSRFAWGLVTDIYEPSLETKVAILKKKAESSNEIVADDALYFIAEQVTSNIRELEGALVRVIAFASLTQQQITLELAQRVLDRGVPVKKEKVVDFESIVKVVNKNYGSTMAELCSKTRNKHVTFTRHVAMYFMKQLTEKSLRDIGHFLGGRDHTTVVHALDKIERQIQDNPTFGLELKRIENELTS